MQPDIQDDEATVVFHRVYPAAIPPMRADKAALGIMPTMAYRHCEPMRTASAFGWYIFPPEDIFLKWNGADIFYMEGEEWLPLSHAHLPGFPEYWDECAPEELKGLAPRFLSRLQIPGFVQIWSGLLCGASPGWSLLVRPPVNMRSSYFYSCFEGVVEADQFKPFPLFINIQLIATDVVIEIPKMVPLFQVQPLMRSTYSESAHRSADREGLQLLADGQPAMTAADWAGYRNTIRVEASNEAPESGRYTSATRKRTKHDESN